jgi:hypothetical protein
VRRVLESRSGQILLWCLPALVLGGWLRFEMLAGWRGGLYFGPDSGSYWESAYRFAQGTGGFELGAKRPWLYPAIIWLASHGPVSPAFSVALAQQLATWLSILALGALVRALLPAWKIFIVPTTVLYAAHPEILYWGHVLIADSFFISITVAVALVAVLYWKSPRWQWLAVAILALFVAMALRPVGRALWLSFVPIAVIAPGLPWRTRLAHAGVLAIVYLPASSATAVKQGADLLFVSTLPLIRLDTPLHADLKAELRPQVEVARADLWNFITVGQRQVWGEMVDDDPADTTTLLQSLRADKKRYTQVRRDISREALRHAPLRYAGMVAMKIYYVFSLRDAHERLAPDRWLGANEKFLDTASRKIDARFPAFVLRDHTVVDRETLRAALARTLIDARAQARVLPVLDRFEPVTLPFSLSGKMPDRWWWIVPIAAGALVFPCTRRGRALLPVLILAAGYLVMTCAVGRAVGRYRLPVEFTLYVTASAGLAIPLALRAAGAAKKVRH